MPASPSTGGAEVGAQELLDRLVGLAQDAGLAVRVATGSVGAPGEDLGMKSGTCRLRDRLLIVLAPRDSLADRIAVVAEALALHRPDVLEERYLPPAVRECLEAAGAA